jgi:hypothetical protein
MTEAALELQHLQGDQQILKAVAPAQALRQAAADQAISGGDAGAERAVVSRDERHLIPQHGCRLLQCQRAIDVTAALQRTPGAELFPRHHGIDPAVRTAVAQQQLLLPDALRFDCQLNAQAAAGNCKANIHLHTVSSEATSQAKQAPRLPPQSGGFCVLMIFSATP